jgi:hypothetical protein
VVLRMQFPISTDLGRRLCRSDFPLQPRSGAIATGPSQQYAVRQGDTDGRHGESARPGHHPRSVGCLPRFPAGHEGRVNGSRRRHLFQSAPVDRAVAGLLPGGRVGRNGAGGAPRIASPRRADRAVLDHHAVLIPGVTVGAGESEHPSRRRRRMARKHASSPVALFAKAVLAVGVAAGACNCGCHRLPRLRAIRARGDRRARVVCQTRPKR